MELRNTDKVFIRLGVKGRNGTATIDLNETVTVEQLGLKAGGARKAAPNFDGAHYARLLTEGSDKSIQAALDMRKQFEAEVADYHAAGNVVPSEALATAVVDWCIRTSPQGQVFSRDNQADAYVISEKEINIAFGEAFGERAWKVSAVATWG